MYIKIFKWLHKSITPSLYRQLPITFVCIHFITMRFTTFYARKCRDFCKIHNFYSLIGKFLWHVTIVNPFQYFTFTRRFSCEIAQWAVDIQNWFLRFQLQKSFCSNLSENTCAKMLNLQRMLAKHLKVYQVRSHDWAMDLVTCIVLRW